MSAIPNAVAELIPDITDSDIERVEHLLGVRLDPPRRDVLRSNGNFDVQACPGSGKTTLLVAKLAILAKKWPFQRRGICVLSHTNVARQEIEKRLAGTAAGQRLLTYPHFVGTIHSFVNEYLALPLLRSEGKSVLLIDDEIHGDFCRRQLHSVISYSTAKVFLEKHEQYSPDRTIRSLRYVGPNFGLDSAAGIPCGQDTSSYRQLESIKKKAADKGFWRHDDMFSWAERLLEKCSEVIAFARWRFPAIFIDELQDTSEMQSRILNKIFPALACELRQRFGDSNQAIYDFGQARAITDPFPGQDTRSVPNSKRFASDIATKVSSLAPVPTRPALVGEGPPRNLFPVSVNHTAMPHTIFLFGADSAKRVLPAFGSLLLATFPDEVLRHESFHARAIGRIGKSDAADGKFPRHLGDYWEGYESGAAKPELNPPTLADYIHLVQRRHFGAVDCNNAVRMAIKGITNLIDLVAPDKVHHSSHSSRWIWESVKNDCATEQLLKSLLWDWCVEPKTITEQNWSGHIETLRKAIQSIIGEQWCKEADSFCGWSVEFASPTTEITSSVLPTPNIYRFTNENRFVDIDVGTIHSAKGQTHTATLVLETFYKKYDMQDLLDLLSCSNCGAKLREGPERLERMRLIYTAMTRPTHLLCLAMRLETLGQNNAQADHVKKFQNLGWNVENLDDSIGV